MYFLTSKSPQGYYGLVWQDGVLHRVYLPETSHKELTETILEEYPQALRGEADGWIIDIQTLVTRVLNGELVEDNLPIHTAGWTDFESRVYRAVQKIPGGQVVSYGDIAGIIGHPGAARAVGTALRKNRYPLLIPCHRVVASGGKIGGFTAKEGLELKKKLLRLEGCLSYG
jgi:methylated-DNA-[protein]-cysteine S-methyltransferase